MHSEPCRTMAREAERRIIIGPTKFNFENVHLWHGRALCALAMMTEEHCDHVWAEEESCRFWIYTNDNILWNVASYCRDRCRVW